MDQLLSGLDTEFHSTFQASDSLAIPPSAKQTKNLKEKHVCPGTRSRSPTPTKSPGESPIEVDNVAVDIDITAEDISVLFEGAENWDWNDMPSPVKPKSMVWCIYIFWCKV